MLLPILSLLGDDAILLLDHDLCFEDAAFPDAGPESGQRVARFLAATRFQGSGSTDAVGEVERNTDEESGVLEVKEYSCAGMIEGR